MDVGLDLKQYGGKEKMHKIRKVKILSNREIKALEADINHALRNGWELYRELCLNDKSWYYATMVKYKEVLR